MLCDMVLAGCDAAEEAQSADGESPDGRSPDGQSPDGESPDCGDCALDALEWHAKTVRSSLRLRCSEVHTRTTGPVTQPRSGIVHADGCVVRRAIGNVPQLVSQDDAEERVVDLQLPVVFDEPELPELVHEEIHARARGPDHLGQRFL